MDIGSISGVTAIQHGASLMVMNKAMDTMQAQMQGLMQMMEQAVPPTDPNSAVGQNFDIKV